MLCTNDLGKRAVEKHTLFYMPHCGFSLYNGVVWSNWGANLRNVTILGNRFSGYDELMITDEKRNMDHNSVLQVLPYWNEVVILDGAAKIDKYTYRPIFDSFHSMAVQYITNEEYERACQNALWSKRPGEPVIVDDVSTEVNPEVVAFLNRQCTEEDAMWNDLENTSSADYFSLVPSRRIWPSIVTLQIRPIPRFRHNRKMTLHSPSVCTETKERLQRAST